MKSENIELAKSWFVAAQLCMILAGFLFTSSSLAWTNMRDSVESGLVVANNVLDKCGGSDDISCYNEVDNASLNYYNDSIYSNLRLWWVYFFIAIILTFASFRSWEKGREELGFKLKKKVVEKKV